MKVTKNLGRRKKNSKTGTCLFFFRDSQRYPSSFRPFQHYASLLWSRHVTSGKQCILKWSIAWRAQPFRYYSLLDDGSIKWQPQCTSQEPRIINLVKQSHPLPLCSDMPMNKMLAENDTFTQLPLPFGSMWMSKKNKHHVYTYRYT